VVTWELINAYIERTLTGHGRAHLGPRARTLLPLARSVALIVLTTLAVFTILSEIGLDIGPLLAGAGVIGLAVGFGSQTLVKDIVTGVFILTENQVSVGDVVRIGTHLGQVEAITIRTMRLRDAIGTIHIVPFSEVQAIENMTRDFSRYVFNLRVSQREDVDQVIAALNEVGKDLQADPDVARRIIGGLEVLGVDQFDDNAMVILGQITTRPNEHAPVGREFNRRMKKVFDARGIELASPRRTVYFGTRKEGDAPPARVQVIE
jgi:small conductance mechanosensitive channel